MKTLSLIAMALILTAAAHAKGVFCNSVSATDGQVWYVEAHVTKNLLTKLSVSRVEYGEQGERLDDEDFIVQGSAKLNSKYKPTSTKYKNLSNYTTMDDDARNPHKVEVLLPKKLGKLRSTFTAYLRINGEHEGLVASEELSCRVSEAI